MGIVSSIQNVCRHFSCYSFTRAQKPPKSNLELQKLAQSSPDPPGHSKIEPSAPRHPNSVHEMHKKRPRAKTMHLRTKKASTCPNMPPFSLYFAGGWPPLSMLKQQVDASMKCSGVYYAWHCKQRDRL